MPFDQQQCQRCGEWQQTQAGNPNRTQAFFAQPPTANYPRPGYPYGSATQNQDRWLIALLLCIFLGHLGIHRFYMGHTGAGVAILLLSVIGWVTACVAIGFLFLAVAWVWTIVDLVLICTNQLRMADGTPLRY
jgi:TM2 domain-containing membrane protein YozV